MNGIISIEQLEQLQSAMPESCDCVCEGRIDPKTPLIHYWYKLDDVLEEVYKRTTYLGKNKSDEQGAHLLNRIAMTEDDRSIFESFLQNAQANVFDVISPFTHGIDGAYWWNETYNAVDVLEVDILGGTPYNAEKGTYIRMINNDTTVEYYYATEDTIITEDGGGGIDFGACVQIPDYQNSVHYITWHKDWFNKNVLRSVDNGIFEALVLFVLSRHYDNVLTEKESDRYRNLYDEQLTFIGRRLNAQHKCIDRHYTWY